MKGEYIMRTWEAIMSRNCFLSSTKVLGMVSAWISLVGGSYSALTCGGAHPFVYSETASDMPLIEWMTMIW